MNMYIISDHGRWKTIVRFELDEETDKNEVLGDQTPSVVRLSDEHTRIFKHETVTLYLDLMTKLLKLFWILTSY